MDGSQDLLAAHLHGGAPGDALEPPPARTSRARRAAPGHAAAYGTDHHVRGQPAAEISRRRVGSDVQAPSTVSSRTSRDDRSARGRKVISRCSSNEQTEWLTAPHPAAQVRLVCDLAVGDLQGNSVAACGGATHGNVCNESVHFPAGLVRRWADRYPPMPANRSARADTYPARVAGPCRSTQWSLDVRYWRRRPR